MEKFTTSDLEQITVSIMVSRQANNLPKEMVEYHDGILVNLGLVSQSMLPLAKLTRGEYMAVIDSIQVKLLKK